MSEPADEPVKVGGLVTVTKYGSVIPVTRQMLVENGLVKPTPAEQREMDTRHVAYELRKQAATVALPVFVAALATVTDPVARAVLDLHKADGCGDCEGCDFGGYECEPPEWPCRTSTTIAAMLGIDVPPDLDMVVRQP
jgi:hypothetical protein